MNNERPGLAILSNCVTPYRINLHKLVAAGIPEFRLHSLFSHGAADFAWALDCPPEINACHFGPADPPMSGWFHAPLAEWRKGGRIIDYLQQNNVQAIIINGARYISHLRTIQHCQRAGIPLFIRNDSNIRGERLSPLKQWIKARIYAWLLRRATGVMSMGELGDQFFLKYGANPQRLYHVPYWPDYDQFARCDVNRLEAFCRRFRLRPNRQRLLYSGRLVPQKRVDLLIDAFAAVADQRADWDLLIVGDGRLREQLRARVPQRLRERVQWTGFLEQEDCAVAYHAARVLVLPSDREPWALVVQEAMAAGLVVIASDAVGAAHELVEDRRTGRIFPIGDMTTLTQAILDVTEPERLHDYCERSREALAAWREKADPVPVIRRALTDCGVLASGSSAAGTVVANTT